MKKILILISVLLLLTAAAIAGGGYWLYSQRTQLVETRLQQDLKSLLGREIVLEGLTVSRIPNGRNFSAKIVQIEIKNPEKFVTPDLARIKNIEIVFDPAAFLKGNWICKFISADLAKINFQYNAEGMLNISQIPVLQQGASALKNPFWVDRIEYRLGKLYFRNARTTPPEKKTVDLKGRPEVFDDVNDPAVLIQAPFMSLLKELNQGSLGLPRGKIQESLRLHIGQTRPAS